MEMNEDTTIWYVSKLTPKGWVNGICYPEHIAIQLGASFFRLESFLRWLHSSRPMTMRDAKYHAARLRAVGL